MIAVEILTTALASIECHKRYVSFIYKAQTYQKRGFFCSAMQPLHPEARQLPGRPEKDRQDQPLQPRRPAGGRRRSHHRNSLKTQSP